MRMQSPRDGFTACRDRVNPLQAGGNNAESGQALVFDTSNGLLGLVQMQLQMERGADIDIGSDRHLPLMVVRENKIGK